MRPAPVIAALWALAVPLPAMQWSPALDASALAGLSGITGAPTNTSYEGDLFAAPALELSGGRIFSPALYAVAGGQAFAVEEDVPFVQTYVFGAAPSLRLPTVIGTLRLRGEAKRSINLEANGETFGQGLYDYEEFGGGAALEGVVGSPWSLRLDATHRSYPNYHQLGAEESGGKNYYVKDFYGLMAAVSTKAGGAGWAAHGGGSVQGRFYTDSYVTRLDGTLDQDQLQRDWLFEFNGGLDLALNRTWSLGVDIEEDVDNSNQNGFDQSSKPPQALPHVQDYVASRLGGGLAYHGRAWSAGAGYHILFRDSQRPIQTPDGTYTQGKQDELGHTVDARLAWPLSAGLRALANGTYNCMTSNQEFDRAGRSNYSFFSVSAGLEWTYPAADF